MHITFRTDASTQIGTGHVMRCLTLADALKEQGATCHFICREHQGNLIELIKSKGHAVTALPNSGNLTGQARSYTVEAGLSCDQTNHLAHAHWLGTTQEEDARQTIAALHHQTHWLIIDHYALDHTWETLLAPYAKKILVIDDLADRKHHCHILLDQNLGKTPAHYQHLVPEHCALLLGPQYALLQPQYAELHPRTPPRQDPINNILIYFGGSDPHDITGMATRACLELNRPEIQLNLVMGSSYPYKNELEQLAHTHSNITFYQNLPSLAPLMLQADLAIGAGGSTSWERCCLGLPTVIVTVAENQVPLARVLHKEKYAVWLADVSTSSEISYFDGLKETLTAIDLEALSQRCYQLVDGEGTKRVIDHLLKANRMSTTEEKKEFWNERSNHGKKAGTNDLLISEMELKEIEKHFKDGLKVLEVGCGNGDSAIHLASKFEVDIDAVDFSEDMVEQANKNLLEKQSTLKGSVNFSIADIREYNTEKKYDLIFSKRSLINLNSWEEQKEAIKKITNWLKPGGSYLMCENSEEGLNKINEYRACLGLEAIQSPWHNVYFKEDILNRVEIEDVKLLEVSSFGSTYYFLSRVINAAIAKQEGREPSYESPINKLAEHLPPINDCGQTKLWVWRKNDY